MAAGLFAGHFAEHEGVAHRPFAQRHFDRQRRRVAENEGVALDRDVQFEPFRAPRMTSSPPKKRIAPALVCWNASAMRRGAFSPSVTSNRTIVSGDVDGAVGHPGDGDGAAAVANRHAPRAFPDQAGIGKFRESVEIHNQ